MILISAIPSAELFDIIALIMNKFMPFIIGLVVFVLISIFKKDLVNVYKGISFRKNLNFKEDDEIILDGERAMIASIGLFKTKIFMLDENGKPKTARFFLNYTVETMRMEKILNSKGGVK